MSVEEGWQRGYAVVPLDRASASTLLGADVLDLELLAGGLRNTNYRVRLPEGDAVLRLYVAEVAACAREIALLRALNGVVPVPRVFEARPEASPPWALFEYVQGERFDRQDRAAVGAAAYDAGAVLARIHAVPRHSLIHVDLDRYSGPQFSGQNIFERALGYARPYLSPEVVARVRGIVGEHAWRLREQDATLQHSDYKPWNLLVRDGRVAAVLDWEFAFAGPRLNDVGNFVRYSARQPAEYLTRFEAGYREAGGTLPDDWFRLARLQDLIALGFFFERADLDPAMVRDVIPLIERTVALFDT